jgi:hypothetical protein
MHVPAGLSRRPSPVLGQDRERSCRLVERQLPAGPPLRSRRWPRPIGAEPASPRHETVRRQTAPWATRCRARARDAGRAAGASRRATPSRLHSKVPAWLRMPFVYSDSPARTLRELICGTNGAPEPAPRPHRGHGHDPRDGGRRSTSQPPTEKLQLARMLPEEVVDRTEIASTGLRANRAALRIAVWGWRDGRRRGSRSSATATAVAPSTDHVGRRRRDEPAGEGLNVTVGSSRPRSEITASVSPTGVRAQKKPERLVEDWWSGGRILRPRLAMTRGVGRALRRAHHLLDTPDPPPTCRACRTHGGDVPDGARVPRPPHGLATANCLAAVKAGAAGYTSVNGLGERLVPAASPGGGRDPRQDSFRTNVDESRLVSASRRWEPARDADNRAHRAAIGFTRPRDPR